MSKPKLEHRVVCAHFGKSTRHTSHKWAKKDKKKATQSVIDLNHHAEMVGRDHFYYNEAPYRVQIREVTAWGNEEQS